MQKAKRPGLTRRQILTFLVGAATGSAIDIATGGVLAATWRWIYNGWETLSGEEMKARRELFEKIAGRTPDAFSFDVGDRHPLYRGRLHPDNLRLAKAAGRLLMGRDELCAVDDEKCLRVDYEKSIWAIGGAMSTQTAFEAEGYEGEGYRLRKTRGPKLHWRTVYDEDELRQLGLLSYSTRDVEVEGKTVHHTVPNWTAVEGELGRLVPSPQTGNIVYEPLFIRRLPNTLGETPESRQEYILITEAPHGDGTRGFELLLKDRQKLREWHGHVRSYDYFESRFNVRIDRDCPIPEPVDIEHVETRTIEP
jgi:hypothetical protein